LGEHYLSTRIALVGGGGHAAVVIEALRATGVEPAFVVDADRALWGKSVLDVKVAGGDDCLSTESATHFIVTLGAVKAGMDRRRLFELAAARGLMAATVVHPRATVSPSAKIGDGAVILANAAVCARASIGKNVIVNTGAVVEHDCAIGDHVHVATGACLCGDVTVGAAAFVGAGSSVRQGVRIGANAVVGLGSAVIDDVPTDALVKGNPARPAGR
jgi:UDP-perosamine 4-acetyltransferase